MLRAFAVVVVAVLVATGVAAAVGGPLVAGVPALVWLAWLALLINWVAFIPAYWMRTEHFYDLTGALTSLGLTGLSVTLAAREGRMGPVSIVAAAVVVLWAGRLGFFLFRRVRRDGKDGRFDTMKHSAPRFLVAWTLQGLWVFLTTLAAQALVVTGGDFGVWHGIGFALWGAGFTLEVVADRQKSSFRADPANAGRFIDTGLWSWSRHPNYVGEIVMWTGAFVAGCGTWQGTQWLAVVSPVFVYLLLTRISGVPLLEQRADAKWGDDPGYQAYKARTPVMLPLGRG